MDSRWIRSSNIPTADQHMTGTEGADRRAPRICSRVLHRRSIGCWGGVGLWSTCSWQFHRLGWKVPRMRPPSSARRTTPAGFFFSLGPRGPVVAPQCLASALDLFPMHLSQSQPHLLPRYTSMERCSAQRPDLPYTEKYCRWRIEDIEILKLE